MSGALHFRLPLPPSKNELDGVNAGHRMVQERRAMRLIWVKACGQHRPSLDPPAFVIVRAHFYTGNTWDDGNLITALYSLVFDALQKPVGGPPSWRQGLAEFKGFIVDDSDRHLHLAEYTQEIEPNRKRRRLELTIEPVEAP